MLCSRCRSKQEKSPLETKKTYPLKVKKKLTTLKSGVAKWTFPRENKSQIFLRNLEKHQQWTPVDRQMIPEIDDVVSEDLRSKLERLFYAGQSTSLGCVGSEEVKSSLDSKDQSPNKKVGSGEEQLKTFLHNENSKELSEGDEEKEEDIDHKNCTQIKRECHTADDDLQFSPYINFLKKMEGLEQPKFFEKTHLDDMRNTLKEQTIEEQTKVSESAKTSLKENDVCASQSTGSSASAKSVCKLGEKTELKLSREVIASTNSQENNNDKEKDKTTHENEEISTKRKNKKKTKIRPKNATNKVKSSKNVKGKNEVDMKKDETKTKKKHVTTKQLLEEMENSVILKLFTEYAVTTFKNENSDFKIFADLQVMKCKDDTILLNSSTRRQSLIISTNKNIKMEF